MAPIRCGHLDIQIGNALDQRNIAVRGVDQQFIRTGARSVIHAFQHLEGTLCVAAHGTQNGCCLDTAHPARIGNRHALHVFDDIAGTGNVHMLGLAAQGLARQRCGICDGNRLGATKRANKFAIKGLTICDIADGIGGHGNLLNSHSATRWRINEYLFQPLAFDSNRGKTASRLPTDGKAPP